VELARLEALLRRDQRRFDQADALLARAARLSRESGDDKGTVQNLD
jgi:hypothetical protein